MKKSLVLLALTAVSVSSATPANLCSNDFVEIAQDGKEVRLTKEGSTQYDIKRDASGFLLKPKNWTKEGWNSASGMPTLRKIGIGKDGRAESIQYYIDDYGSTGISTLNLAYKETKGGIRCYDKSIDAGAGKVYSDVDLCFELKTELEKLRVCSESSDQKISKIIEKYPLLERPEKTGLRIETAIAGFLLGDCNSYAMLNKSLNDPELWQDHATVLDGAGATKPGKK